MAYSQVGPLPSGITRTWIGTEFWANRLQDWRLSQGRIECRAAGTNQIGRTVALLTREVVTGNVSGQLSVRTGTIATGGGFSGFLIGAGAGKLDYRAAALVQAASGTGGGILCTYHSDGSLHFREHTNETKQFEYAPLVSSSGSGRGPLRTTSEDVELRLDLNAQGLGKFELKLSVIDPRTGSVLAWASKTGVSENQLVGGIALVSSSYPNATGATHWFRDVGTSGAKIATRPERAMGPILGVLYSLNGSVLKLTAQFLPIGASEPQEARLQFRQPGGTWQLGPSAPIGGGYTALYRIPTWDSSRAWEFRIAYGVGTPYESFYTGTIARDPVDKASVVVGMVNCTIHSHRTLDKVSSGATRLPGGSYLGLYTAANLYFPYAQLVENIRKQQPDLLVSFGDQFYQSRPTRQDTSKSPTLDSLYRYSLWLWSFGDITRHTPTIVLIDDHDVYHGNLWGHSGAAAGPGGADTGGYVKSASWVNTIQRMQCGHNPDAYDPTPVLQGISVYYGTFSFGGANFAVVEDRKFKTGDADGRDGSGNLFTADELELLGVRQERFLSAWTTTNASLPKICLTQSLYACLQTDTSGQPRVDHDSNGYPPGARSRAVQLLKSARAVILCGDQHLGSLVRHGLQDFGDGPLQFTAPAAGSSWQRWFEPAAALPGAHETPYTGRWTDAFGNRLDVLAVANPKVTFAQYRQAYAGKTQELGDRNLKREGYGIVRVDKAAKQFVVECWPHATDPTTPGAAQFPGWPYRLSFDSV